MAHYRRLNTSIWNDPVFNELSRDAQLVFLFISTHQHLTSLGAMRGSIPGLAAELTFKLSEFEFALIELQVQGLVQVDAKAPFIWLPHFLKYHPPTSQSVIQSWEAVLLSLPDCPTKTLMMKGIKRLMRDLPASFQVVLSNLFEELYA
jgi:hypothetical protein